MDDFNRSSTALVSRNNTEYVPCANSDVQNTIQVTIPTTQVAPSWATRYKLVIKPDKESYETIYSSIFFNDSLTGTEWFMIEAENARKVEEGTRLIVKADTTGAIGKCTFATVLEKGSYAKDFIQPPPVALDGTTEIPVPDDGLCETKAGTKAG